MNMTLVQQEPTLPANNEEVIQMLGLDGFADSNTGKLVDDIVRKLDIDSFIFTSSGVPAAAIGFEGLQAPTQLVGTAYQPAEIVSYVDLTPVITPFGYENSPYHDSEDSSYSFNEDSSPPVSPQEVKHFVPSTPAENLDSRSSAGGKVSRRRRELKVKLYERDEPLTNPEEEKKRQNAINAKKNRDRQKNKLQEMETQVTSLTAERDSLKATNIKLKNKCESFEKQLKAICQQFNVPVIILPQD